ncbi:hypothetical protein M422DRAFT_46535 [Sphaerobolus stellatus SS14]|uniref:Uncharacterized protein n=1 Tax=Sphaerobolus stellatus (strain SS14) TaxID=990650 RepID=A0A0C9W403_SPHS4|nr:hypothetical protein M422DRAFT_46535 [Sphaerobolus stellatus SS14]
MATAVSALILGLKPNPEISLHDAIVVIYLLVLAWMALTACLPSCNHFQIKDQGTDNSVSMLKLVSVVQSYLLFALALVLLIQTPSFGSYPECNQNAVAVIFGPFKVFKAGRIVGGIVMGIVILLYSAVTILDYIPQKQKDQVKEIWINRRRPQIFKFNMNSQPTSNTETRRPRPARQQSQLARINVQSPLQRQDKQRHYVNFSGEIVSKLFMIIFFWAIAVVNTELLIRFNHFAQPDGSQSIWQFGQILPLFLLVLPLASAVNAFKKHGLRRWMEDKPIFPDKVMMGVPQQKS